MPITSSATPNPQAAKFTVGQPVGGPATYTDPESAAEPAAEALLRLNGVASVFLTADFITVTKTPEADWAELTSEVVETLTTIYG